MTTVRSLRPSARRWRAKDCWRSASREAMTLGYQATERYAHTCHSVSVDVLAGHTPSTGGLDPLGLARHLRVLGRVGQVAGAVLALVPVGQLQQRLDGVAGPRAGDKGGEQVAHLGEPGRHG